MVRPPLLSVRPNRETLTSLWNKMASVPGGKTIFSRLVGRAAPYTGTIKADVMRLKPGFAHCRLSDRRRIRNHLHSIHAIALANFIEETTGLAMVSVIPVDMRGIVVRLEIDYVKKARGELQAECQAPEVVPGQSAQYRVETHVKNSDGEVVAIGCVVWRIGPRLN